MSVATLNGINIFYEIVGNGPPVVFIHGGYGGADSTVMPRDDSW
ncbi:MAG: alpha/beta hydrolase, partial [SAR202 cluster bacterium]|nr:alpha/beta hydrolase [SAR202 cluster bacterium]